MRNRVARVYTLCAGRRYMDLWVASSHTCPEWTGRATWAAPQNYLPRVGWASHLGRTTKLLAQSGLGEPPGPHHKTTCPEWAGRATWAAPQNYLPRAGWASLLGRTTKLLAQSGLGEPPGPYHKTTCPEWAGRATWAVPQNYLPRV